MHYMGRQRNTVFLASDIAAISSLNDWTCSETVGVSSWKNALAYEKMTDSLCYALKIEQKKGRECAKIYKVAR